MFWRVRSSPKQILLKNHTVKSIFEIAYAQTWAGESMIFSEAKHLLELTLITIR